MKIGIAGMTGLVGGSFAVFMSKKGHEIVSIRREHFILDSLKLADHIRGCDAIYNFVGAPVIKRWTKKHKIEIKSSRTLTTRKLVEAMEQMDERPEFFFNASAIGYYDYENIHTEESINKGSGFLSKVVASWEKEADRASLLGIRLVKGRIGVVMDANRGALPKMVKPFYFGMGGMIGTGKQIVSFIHIQDLLAALEYVLITKSLSGAVNLVAPKYCSNREMSQMIGILINKPSFMRIPYLVINLAFGQAADVIRGGEKVIPEKLQSSDFQFKYPDIYAALTDLL